MSSSPKVNYRRLSEIQIPGSQHRYLEPKFPRRKGEGICVFEKEVLKLSRILK